MTKYDGMANARPKNSDRRPRHLPGEEGVWVFILGDMMIFSLFFCVYSYYRSLEPALYLQSQALLNQNFGAINTIFLLASSWFVVLAVHSVRGGEGHLAPRFIALAFLCGLAFAVVKVLEYSEKIGEGISLVTNEFFMYYFIFTGIHFLHVLIGLAVLAFLWRRARSGVHTKKERVFLESGASFWHMVDLLWIVLFPLLYLMR